MAPIRQGHPGWIVAASLLTGLLAALLLVAAPFVPVQESARGARRPPVAPGAADLRQRRR